MNNTCERRFKMYFDFRVGEYYRSTVLAQRYDVDIRTIQRDICFFKRLKLMKVTQTNDGKGGFYVSNIRSRR